MSLKCTFRIKYVATLIKYLSRFREYLLLTENNYSGCDRRYYSHYTLNYVIVNTIERFIFYLKIVSKANLISIYRKFHHSDQ